MTQEEVQIGTKELRKHNVPVENWANKLVDWLSSKGEVREV